MDDYDHYGNHQVCPPSLDDLPMLLLHHQRDVLGSHRHYEPHHPHRQLRPGHLRHHQRCTGRSYCQVREDFFNRTKFLLHLSADGLQGEQCFIYLILLVPSALIIVNNT